jgi:MATE family multidrug resistance protein
LDTLVSQFYGAGKVEECHRSLFHGIYLSVLLAPVLTGVMLGIIPYLDDWGIAPEVLELTVPYLELVTWSLFPLLLYACFRRYLQALDRVKPVMVVLISANVVNALTNWILIFGNLGAPELGVIGAGWATFVSRVYLSVGLLGYILYDAKRRHTGLFRASFAFDLGRFRRLLALGFPAAAQITLEMGVFAAATALAGKLDSVSLAAHQIALTAASFTFMVPLGVSSAGAVRVGHAIGRGDPKAAGHAGWTALLLGAGFMSAASLAFLLVPGVILRVFTTDVKVISAGVALLFVAALFQLFDGVQVVATGILRGSGDTRTPMLSTLFGHWLLGLPIGVTLCFAVGWGVVGLWVGLSTGLIAVGIVLLFVWSRRVRILVRSTPAG